MEQALSDRWLRARKPSKDERVTDSTWTLPGSFGVLIRAGSLKKTFYYSYSNRGRRQLKTLGSYPAVSLADARKAAVLLRSHLDQGHTIPRGTRSNPGAFKALCELFAKWHFPKLRKKTAQDYKNIINKELLPKFANYKLQEITRADLIEVLDAAMNRGAPTQANRIRAVASKLFAFAVARDMLQHSPAAGIERPARERKGTRVLSIEECALLWSETAKLPLMTGAAIRLLLLTGQRPGEVLSMKWQHIAGNLWTLPAENTKNARKHCVFLTQTALNTLAPLRSITAGREFVFWGKGNIELRGLKHAMKQLNTKSAIFPKFAGEDGQDGKDVSPTSQARPTKHTKPQIAAASKGLEPFCLRDLRRTVQTQMTAAGVRPDIVDRVLNHNVPGVRAHYDLYSYAKEIEQALTCWERVLLEAIKENTLPK